MLTKSTTTTAPAQGLDRGQASSRHASIRREMQRRAVVELVIWKFNPITAWTATDRRRSIRKHLLAVWFYLHQVRRLPARTNLLKELTCEARKPCKANKRLTNCIACSGEVLTSVARRARMRRICISSMQMSADARISQKGVLAIIHSDPSGGL